MVHRFDLTAAFVEENPSNTNIMGVKEEDKTNYDQCNLLMTMMS